MSRTNYKRSNSNNNRSQSEESKNGSFKGRGKKPYSRGDARDEKNFKKSSVKDAINDISWYAHNPQMLKDAASIAFNQMLGLPMYFGPFSVGGTGSIVDKLPGIITLKMVPCFGSSTTGITDDPNSAINIAAQNLYSYVRHVNSGHSNYDPVDLMIYVAAMDQAYAYHAELVRLYGLMRFYSGFNRYIGKYLVEALGYDYDNLLPNLAGLRYLINSFAARLCTFAVPAIFPLFERHRQLYSFVYMDRPSTRAQLYAFVPERRGIYVEPVEADGTAYKSGVRGDPVAPGYLWTLSDIKNQIDEVISPLLHSEDIGIMSGDILKAYGPDKCYQINALPEDWIMGPVYVEEVLRQIHNSNTIGDPLLPVVNSRPMLVYQDGTSPLVKTWDHSDFIIPLLSASDPGAAVVQTGVVVNPHILDTNVDSPDPEETMIITRLLNIPRAINTTTAVASDVVINSSNNTVKALHQDGVFTSMGADAVEYYLLYNGELDGNGHPKFSKMYSHVLKHDHQNISEFMNRWYSETLSDFTKFCWHPIITEYGLNAATWNIDTPSAMDHSQISLRIYADLDNCVTVTKDTINRMHDVAILSMLNVPSAVLTKGV